MRCTNLYTPFLWCKGLSRSRATGGDRQEPVCCTRKPSAKGSGTTHDLTFRRLVAADLPLLGAWLAVEPALRWYAHGKAPTAEELGEKYLPRIRGEIPISCWILMRQGHAAGFFQTYRLCDFPDHPAGPRPRAAALDYLLAPTEIGQGLAAPALLAFLRDVVFAAPDILRCYADPDPANLASVRSLRRAGFHRRSGVQPAGFLLLSCSRRRVLAQS